jgi:glycosyltransferase involved in cell wall biosynthesis
VFYPVSRETPIILSDGTKIATKKAAKVIFGYPEDSFLVLRVDSNSPRKDYGASWRALVPVMKKHSDIVVHFHCTGNGLSGGVLMPALFTRDMQTAPRFHLADEFDTFENWPISHLAALYNAADVFLSNSQGEGFGLTISEALACGTPVIAQDCSSITEVVGPGGVLIPPGFPITHPGGEDMFVTDAGAFSEAIEHLYLNDGYRKRYSKAAVDHVTKTFNWDVEAAKLDKIIVETVEQTEIVAEAV